jgi:hypothetical protein
MRLSDRGRRPGGPLPVPEKQGKRDEAIAEFRKARDTVKRGSKLAQLIEKALNELDH